MLKFCPANDVNIKQFTTSGWLIGKLVHLSCGRSLMPAPAVSYQRSS